jgi:hypothetical protein
MEVPKGFFAVKELKSIGYHIDQATRANPDGDYNVLLQWLIKNPLVEQ